MKVLDLFSGIGGFSLGLERTGQFETAAFCELDPFCRSVLSAHWPTVPIHDDIRSLTHDRLTFAPDVVCGGFPCQDVSNAGRRTGLAGPSSGLWFDMHRIIRDTEPRWVIVENSAHGRRHWLPTAIGGLRELGYETVALEIAAHDIGANHERRRCWVLAHSGRGRCELATEAPYKQGGRALSFILGGPLNPEYVEWMMGYPIGWTACVPSATPSSL